jgi:DNA polymerase-3 subunit delta
MRPHSGQVRPAVDSRSYQHFGQRRRPRDRSRNRAQATAIAAIAVRIQPPIENQIGLTGRPPEAASAARYAVGVAKKAATNPLSGSTKIAVLVGKEPFLQAEYTTQLRDALTKAHGEVDTIRFDGLSAALADVLDECRTFGLMQQHKLVVVENAEQLIKEDSRPLIERYAEAPVEGATLLLRAERWYPGKLDKLIEAGGGSVIKFEEIPPGTAMTWAMKRSEKRHAARLDPAAAELLVMRIGAELGRIDTELAKLALAAGEQAGGSSGPPTITKELVGEMVGLTREEEAWVVQESLLSGDPARAVGHMRMIMDTSRRDAHVPLSWACLDLARKLHAAARGLREGADPWQLGGKLKLWPPEKKEAVLGAAKRADPGRLRELFRAAIETDRRMKSGYGDPERGLEVLALKFAEALGGGQLAGRR